MADRIDAGTVLVAGFLQKAVRPSGVCIDRKSGRAVTDDFSAG